MRSKSWPQENAVTRKDRDTGKVKEKHRLKKKDTNHINDASLFFVASLTPEHKISLSFQRHTRE